MTTKWYEIPGVILLMLALALVSTYPLVLHFDSGIPYGIGQDITWNRSGDQLQLLYWFWLVKENILGHVPFDTNPFEFNTGTVLETTGFHTFPLALLYLLFSPFGDVAAYNCTIITTYVLAGTYMYLLILLYSGSRVGALLGAFIFTFAPSRLNGIAGGNIYGMLFFLYPWIIYYLEKGVRSQKIVYGVLSGLGLICLSMLESHLLYYICLFLAVYFPIRLVVLVPECRLYMGRQNHIRGFFTFSNGRCLFLLWMMGIGIVLYSQALFSGRDQDPFFSQFFWWIIGLYPVLAVLIGVCFALVCQRLSSLDFGDSLALETKALSPLLLFYPLAIVPYIDDTIDTTIVLLSTLSVISISTVFVFRKHISLMLETLSQGIRIARKSLWPVIPVIVALGYIVFWIPTAKVNKLSSTIAAKGRTLQDVRLFSAHIEDLFFSSSNVYIGAITAVFMGFLFVTLLWVCIRKKSSEKVGRRTDMLLVFYSFIGFCGFLLSLGLAFGKSSMYLLLYNYLPYFNYPRVSDRIAVLALFAMAIAIGFFVHRIQQCFSGGRLWMVTGIVLFAAIAQLKDFNVHRDIGITLLHKGQDIYNYVKKNIGDGLLLEIPLWPGDSHQSSLYQYLIMLDKIPRVNGYSPLVRNDYVEDVFKPLIPLNKGILEEKHHELLKKMGVKYITVHRNSDIFPEKVSEHGPITTIRRFQNSPFLKYIDMLNIMYYKTSKGVFYNLYLFEVKDKVEDDYNDEQPYWYEMPRIFTANYRLTNITGERVEDETRNMNLFRAIGSRHDPGILVYGPYTNLSAGNYLCYFHIKAVSPGNQNIKIARIQVIKHRANGEQVVLAESELYTSTENKGYSRIPLAFSLKEYAKLEFRVFYHGRGDLYVEQVTIFPSGQEAPLEILEAEKMVGDTGLTVSDSEASGGKVVEALIKVSEEGDLVYGPSKAYPEGKYKVHYIIRMLKTKDLKKSTPAAVIYVTDEHNVRFFAERKVRAEHLQKNEFKKISVEFETATEEELSFHLRFRDKVNLQLDRIEVEKLE